MGQQGPAAKEAAPALEAAALKGVMGAEWALQEIQGQKTTKKLRPPPPPPIELPPALPELPDGMKGQPASGTGETK